MRLTKVFIIKQIEYDNFENYKKMIFIDYKYTWDEKWFSEIFMREMNKWELISMRFQKYHQITNLWMKKYLKKIKLKKNILNHQIKYNSGIIEMRYKIISENINKLILKKLLAFFHTSLQ